MERTFSFSDDSINVALPSAPAPLSTGLTEQSHIFLHNSEPAWHLVKIRQILSAAYQRKYFNVSDSVAHSLASNWTLFAKAREWFDHAPKAAPRYFPMLYKLEHLYTNVMTLSPTIQYSTLCDYDKVLLFDRCIQYIAELYRILQNDSWLPYLTFLDIQRSYPVVERFIDAHASHVDDHLGIVRVEPQVRFGCGALYFDAERDLFLLDRFARILQRAHVQPCFVEPGHEAG